jgi:hypothetical protein
MARKILLDLFLLALPFLIYIAYVKLGRRAQAEGGIWTGAPWFWLFSSGLMLTIAAAVLLVVFDGSEPGSAYLPAVVEDGRIVPGRFE